MSEVTEFGKSFREMFHYEGKLTKNEMGPELWNEYYKIISKNRTKSEKYKKEIEERKIKRKQQTIERNAEKRLNGDGYIKYCSTPELIENFHEAQKDNFKGWILHHKLEQMFTAKELIDMGIYYNCKPGELIFLRTSEHNHNARLHYGVRICDKTKCGRPRKIL